MRCQDRLPGFIILLSDAASEVFAEEVKGMAERTCFIGLDQPESDELRRLCSSPSVAYPMLPRIKLLGGQLFVEASEGLRYLPVSRVVFHGIFEHDLDFLAAL